MYNPKELNAEIEAVIRHRIEAGEIVRKEWICHEVLSQHPLPEFPDSDFTAAKAEKSEDALRFSQAACNAANAMCAVKAALREAAA